MSGATCWIFAGLFWAMAADDPRGTKVAAYNAAVTTWLEGGAFATWAADNAGITTFPIVVGTRAKRLDTK